LWLFFFLDDFTAAALALSTGGTGLATVKDALFYMALAGDGAATSWTNLNLFGHLTHLLFYLPELYAHCWQPVSDFCLTL
jgi:hypothetical protein